MPLFFIKGEILLTERNLGDHRGTLKMMALVPEDHPLPTGIAIQANHLEISHLTCHEIEKETTVLPSEYPMSGNSSVIHQQKKGHHTVLGGACVMITAELSTGIPPQILICLVPCIRLMKVLNLDVHQLRRSQLLQWKAFWTTQEEIPGQTGYGL